MLLCVFFIQHYTMSISSLKLLKTHLGLLILIMLIQYSISSITSLLRSVFEYKLLTYIKQFRSQLHHLGLPNPRQIINCLCDLCSFQ